MICYQMKVSRKYWTLKRQKFLHEGFTYWKVWTPSNWVGGGFCNQSPKATVPSCSKIHRLCQILYEVWPLLMLMRRWQCQIQWQVQETQLNTLRKADGCSKAIKCSIQPAEQYWQKVGLSFIRCTDEHSWEVIIAIIIIVSPSVSCLGSSCNCRALEDSKETGDLVVKELFCYLSSGTFL